MTENEPGTVTWTVTPLELAVALGLLDASVLEAELPEADECPTTFASSA